MSDPFTDRVSNADTCPDCDANRWATYDEPDPWTHSDADHHAGRYSDTCSICSALD